MTKKRANQAEVEGDELENSEEIVLSEDEINLYDEVSRVASILGAGSGDLELRVYRIPKTGGAKRPFLFRMEPTDVSTLEERLQTEHGSGDYEVRLWDGKMIHRRIRIEVEAPVKKAGEPVQQNQQTDIAGMLREIMGGFQTMMTSQQQETKIMMLELANKMKPAEQGSMMDMIQALVALQGLQPKQEKSQSPVQQLSEIMAIMEGVKELQADAEPATETGSLLKTVGELLMSAKEMHQFAAQNPQQPRPQNAPVLTPIALTPPTTEPVTNPTPKTEQEQLSMINHVLQQKIKGLLKHAKADHNPDTYAEVLLDEVPELYLPKLAEFCAMGTDAMFAKIAELNLETRAHEDWFKDFCDALIELLADDDLPPGDESGISDSIDPENSPLNAVNTTEPADNP